MFKGIIEAVGTIDAVADRQTTRRFDVHSPDLAGELAPGDSVAVDGACLTVVELGEDRFSVDVIGTTLEKTVAGSYVNGSRVNLERALLMGGRIDGHLVQGHVDGVGRLERRMRDGEFWILDVRLPPEIADLTVRHGSVTINGVSLTVSDLPAPDVCRVGLIPFTHAHTNLGGLAEGAAVNVEGDLIGKYVGRILAGRGQTGSIEG
jgi:riboflavin synthase